MPSEKIVNSCQESMEKAIVYLQKEFRMTRTGRATPVLIENIRVNAYGAEVPLKQCATISTPEARQLMVKPFDISLLKEIEKSLLSSELGVTPQNDGKIIRLTFPPLTEERRKKLAQEIKAKGEEAKVSVRNSRRDAVKSLDDMEKKKEISEDDLKKVKERIQNLVKDYEKKIDTEIDSKSKEVMEI